MTERIYNKILIKKKTSSTLMRLLGWLLLPFSPNFMSKYWTTLGTTIYVPESVDLDDFFEIKYNLILLHEYKHISDFKKYHVFFILSYIIPPVFNYFRFVWERRAFMEELRFIYDKNGDTQELLSKIKFISEMLSSSLYLWTWPKIWIKNWFEIQFNLK